MKANVYVTDNNGEQSRICVLATGRAGKVTSDPKGSAYGMYLLSRPIVDGLGRELTRSDGDDFLRQLPIAYSGTRLRIEVV